MTLSNLRFGPRLAIGFGLVLALLATISAVAVWRLSWTVDAFEGVAEREAQAARADLWEALVNLNVTRTLALVNAGDSQALKPLFEPLMKATSAQISELQKTIEAQTTEASGRELLKAIGERRAAYVALRTKVLALKQDGQADEAMAQEAGLRAAAKDYLAALDAFQADQRHAADQRAAATRGEVGRTRGMIVLLALASLALGIAAAWVITRSVTAPLQRAVQVTARIAGGDLGAPIHVQGRDEVAQVLKGLSTMQASLRGLVGDVQRITSSIQLASGEVASGSLDLSARTEQAAASLQQTAASMDQISATVRTTADNSVNARRMTAEASATAQRGGDVVGSMMKTMEAISERSRRIGDITGVIDGIAFQTNILALNAAVEAARAGENGRGFAVVAGEVRSLATRAGDAAREIKALIGTSIDTVESGTQLARDASASMTELIESVQRVDVIVTEISEAAAEQSTGVGQVNQAVVQLDQLTQQNAALVEESAAAAASLQEQAGVLSRSMSVFRLGDGGHDGDLRFTHG